MRAKKRQAAPAADPKKRLQEIAEEIKAGANPESFAKEMDRLLDTEMAARDEEAEAVWEESYRNGGFEE